MSRRLMNIVEVLIVDDEPDDKKKVKNLLESKGYALKWCERWRDVETLLESRAKKGDNAPDVALIDLHFYNDFRDIGKKKDQEGIAIMKRLPRCCKRLKLDPPPMIAFTNKIDNIKRKDVFNAGAIDVIEKWEYLKWGHFSKRILHFIKDNQISKELKQVEYVRDKSIDVQFIKNALAYTKGDISRASDILDISEADVEKIKKKFSV